jgi:hypothetical protein
VSVPAQKSARLYVLTVREDEFALDEAIDCQSLRAVWQSGGPGRWTPTYHDSMVEALDAGGGSQAFLRLAGPNGATGPLVQYVSGRRHKDPDELRAGCVAYLWLPASTETSLGVAFQALADATFAAARSVTKPHVITHDGRPVRSYRIGVHASRWYLERPWPDRVLRNEGTYATYRLKGEHLG